jgi:hypothetical protein
MYSPISKEEFLRKKENDEFVGVEKYCDNLFGVLRTDLDDILKTGSIAVLLVEPSQARAIGKKFCALNIRAVCLYMHCSIRVMLFRMAAATRNRADVNCSYDDVNQIYANHAMDYSNLHRDAEEDIGFDRVIPVNSDSLTGACYPEKIIRPILGTLRNVVREIKIQAIGSTNN